MTQLSTLIQGSGKNAIDKKSYIATSGQTAFTVTYSPPYVDVYQNGVRLNVVDYTATSGTSITLTVGAAVNDEIEVIGFASDASITASFSGPNAPSLPIEGMMWYDTTDGALYVRTGGFWVEASQAGATQGIQGIQGPAGDGVVISGITVTDASYANTDDTAVSLTGGYIKVTGTGFVSGCTIVVGTVIATSVTFISSSEVRAQLPALAAGTYILYVSNPSGAVAIRVNAITFSALPTWVSTSPLPNGKLNTAISIQLSGTSDSAVVYALQSGSTLPAGLALSSGGLLSGTVTGISVETTYNFTVVATDVELQDSPKAFSITITVFYVVARSLRLRSAASASLNRTPAASGSLTTWTMSMWLKRGTVSSAQDIFGALTGSGATTEIYIAAGGTLGFYWNSSNSVVTTALLRDPAAWYHLVFVWDTNNATAANRVSIYINGVLQGITLTGSYPTSGLSSYWNQALSNTIGMFNGSNYVDGQITEINFIDGQALTAASFGEVSVTSGAWVPKAYAGTYGTNGFCLKFADNSANTAAAIGKDSSTNGNNWTPSNISLTAGSTYDSLLDSPVPSSATVANYAVLNPLQNGGGTLSNANLTLTGPSATWGTRLGTIAVTSGKWYYEVTVQVMSGSWGYMLGITQNPAPANFLGFDANGYSYYDTGQKYTNNVAAAYGAAMSLNDVIGVAFDATAGTLTFYKNNVSQGVAYSGLASGTWYLGAACYASAVASVNFGQRPFTYTPPTDFLALNTFNLPASAVLNPATAMAATTYTGNGTYPRTITNTVNAISFQPDLVWIKARNQTYDHILYDSVRGTGTTKSLVSNSSAVEGSNAIYANLSAFTSTGFTVDTTSNTNILNNNANTFVAWQWKAGGAVSAGNNTAGTITSTVSANTTAGFSIVTYTGNGTNGATVGHGLGAKPSLILEKGRGSAYNWAVQGGGVMWTPATSALALNTTGGLNAAQIPAVATTSVFTPSVTAYSNESGVNYVAYCWAPVAGYSKFGTYTGNGSADGPFVYTGFKPRWLMIKRTDATLSWGIFDTSRNAFNVVDLQLYANLSAADNVFTTMDILSNGFKSRSATEYNTSSGTYIYAAFAESAFNFATAR